MSQLAPSLPVFHTNPRQSISKEILEVAEKDYLFLLRGIALQEIDQQIKLKNPPSNLLVDGRRGKQVVEATRSVWVLFGNPSMMIEAIQEAAVEMFVRARNVTGATLAARQFYQQQGKNTVPRPVASFNKEKIGRATDLYVAFPVAHVRKWQWLSRTGRRLTKQSANRTLRAAKIKLRVSKSVFEDVARAVQRRFPTVDVVPAYIDVRNVNPTGKTVVDRIPAIKVRNKLRGSL